MSQQDHRGAGTATLTVGLACILVSSVFFAPLSQTATKFLAGDFPLMQIVFFRALGQTAWMLILFLPRYGLSVFRTKRPSYQLLRSLLLFLSTLCWIEAIATVPLTTASAINFTAPLMVTLLSIPLLGERVGIHRWSAVVLGFAGALVVIQPGSQGFKPEILLLLVAAALFALYQILTKKLTAVDSAETSSIYTLLVALLFSAVFIPSQYESPGEGNWIVWLAFAAIGLMGGLRHYLVVKAYSFAPASVISPFFYTELVGVALLGFLVFDDTPSAATWVGATLIVASGLYIARRERLRAT